LFSAGPFFVSVSCSICSPACSEALPRPCVRCLCSSFSCGVLGVWSGLGSREIADRLYLFSRLQTLGRFLRFPALKFFLASFRSVCIPDSAWGTGVSFRSALVFTKLVAQLDPLACLPALQVAPSVPADLLSPRFGSSFNARPWISPHVCAPAQAAIFPFPVFLACGARRLSLVLYRSPFWTRTDFSIFRSRSCPVQLLTRAPDRFWLRALVSARDSPARRVRPRFFSAPVFGLAARS
jgi:hypothetical protein